MARPQSDTIHKESAVARKITSILNNCEKSQGEVGDEMGFEKSNILTMFKTGRTKFPLNRVASFSAVTGTDPEDLLQCVLEEYHPEVLDTLNALKGRVLSQSERTMLKALREAKRKADQVKGKTAWTDSTDKLEKWAASTAKTLLV